MTIGRTRRTDFAVMGQRGLCKIGGAACTKIKSNKRWFKGAGGRLRGGFGGKNGTTNPQKESCSHQYRFFVYLKATRILRVQQKESMSGKKLKAGPGACFSPFTLSTTTICK